MTSAPAFAKLNLGLVVGPVREDGKHEVVTLLQRVDLHDTVSLAAADELAIEGFPGDTIVRSALVALAQAVDVAPSWRVRIDKQIPIAAGLAGGSSDAATALRLANSSLGEPVDPGELHRIAAALGADVPFFLQSGGGLGTGDGTELEPIDLPVDYVVVLVVPHGESKESTRAVYEAFDERRGAEGFPQRRALLRELAAAVRVPRDLAGLPGNDLASSPLAAELVRAGAFRADVSGAGPTVYGLFDDVDGARAAAATLDSAGRAFVTRPVAAGAESGVAR